MFSKDVLQIDPEKVAAQIESAIRTQLQSLRRRGIVVGLSGGIDSSVVTTLASRAVGPDRVLALLMPERDSASESAELGRMLTTALGVPTMVEELAGVLDAAGCYRRQTEAIRTVFPEFDDTFKFKITIPSILDTDRLNVSELTVQAPGQQPKTSRMSSAAYLQIVAATNFKQRMRKTDGVLPRRPAELRRRGNAQPTRVRPGILREAGRRRGRSQADRAPLQDRRCTRSPSTSGSPRRSGADRRPPTRSRCRRRRRSSTSLCPTRDGPVPVCAQPRRVAAPRRRRHSA